MEMSVSEDVVTSSGEGVREVAWSRLMNGKALGGLHRPTFYSIGSFRTNSDLTDLCTKQSISLGRTASMVWSSLDLAWHLKH